MPDIPADEVRYNHACVGYGSRCYVLGGEMDAPNGYAHEDEDETELDLNSMISFDFKVTKLDTYPRPYHLNPYSPQLKLSMIYVCVCVCVCV